ncbi:MAG: transaldolase family protein [Gemmatimonadaceae bacterium]
MRIFLDSADLGDIDWAVGAGLIDGVTSTPTAVAANAGADHVAHIVEIARRARGSTVVSVIAVDADGIYREGKELARAADNIVVSAPMLEEGMAATRRLAAEGIRVNMSLVFNAAQALLAAKAGASSVSPALGALDDISGDGMACVADTRIVFDNFVCECEILVTDVRHPRHFIEAAKLGADAASVPARVLRSLLVHPLTDKGMDQYLHDWSRQRSKARGGRE